MGIVVNTNVSSMMVQRSLAGATGNISSSLERLSTGFRINKAADDAAGLTISESLRAQARGSAVAQANAQTGVNLLQTAEGDLSIVQENLHRMRDLAVQAANGTNGTAERAAIKDEITQRTKEITRLANSSAFNTIKLLNGSGTQIQIQIGPNFVNTAVSLNSLNIGSPLGKADATALGLNSVGAVGSGTFLDYYFGTAATAASFLSIVDRAINSVSSRRSTIGSLQNRLESTIQSLGIREQNLRASESRIRDVDVAKESAALTKNQILQQASSQLLAQANQTPNIALTLI